mmetsp:Transcript_117197/g.331643  ORF Transcript_117197/g.331643 Transcript_117197/m.331643 type:complete len:94 (-) Transcript_117197:237-518(-)
MFGSSAVGAHRLDDGLRVEHLPMRLLHFTVRYVSGKRHPPVLLQRVCTWCEHKHQHERLHRRFKIKFTVEWWFDQYNAGHHVVLYDLMCAELC